MGSSVLLTNIDVINEANAPIKAINLVQHAVAATLEHELSANDLQVAVLLTTPEKMQQLNKKYNSEDRVTDVLSFNRRAEWRNGKKLVGLNDVEFPDDEHHFLGDIAICYEQVCKQAQDAAITVEHELAKMAVHGTLHLLGYDHASPDDERQMFAKTDVILTAIAGN